MLLGLNLLLGGWLRFDCCMDYSLAGAWLDLVTPLRVGLVGLGTCRACCAAPVHWTWRQISRTWRQQWAGRYRLHQLYDAERRANRLVAPIGGDAQVSAGQHVVQLR